MLFCVTTLLIDSFMTTRYRWECHLLFKSLFFPPSCPWIKLARDLFVTHYNWCRNRAVEGGRSERWRTHLFVWKSSGFACRCVNGIFFMLMWEYAVKLRLLSFFRTYLGRFLVCTVFLWYYRNVLSDKSVIHDARLIISECSLMFPHAVFVSSLF